MMGSIASALSLALVLTAADPGSPPAGCRAKIVNAGTQVRVRVKNERGEETFYKHSGACEPRKPCLFWGRIGFMNTNPTQGLTVCPPGQQHDCPSAGPAGQTAWIRVGTADRPLRLACGGEHTYQIEHGSEAAGTVKLVCSGCPQSQEAQ